MRGIGGFTVAAQVLGATTTWACDINRTAVEAYSAAHSHAFTRPAECHLFELRIRWCRHVGTDIISAGFPCQAFSRVGLRQGYRDARGQVIFHLIQICWVLRPGFMVLECVLPFFDNPQWVEPVCDYFRAMGYGVSIRREQASDYLAQVRTRGILTATRADYWHQATWPLRALFTGSPPPRRATVGSVRVLGPHPPKGQPFLPIGGPG